MNEKNIGGYTCSELASLGMLIADFFADVPAATETDVETLMRAWEMARNLRWKKVAN